MSLFFSDTAKESSGSGGKEDGALWDYETKREREKERENEREKEREKFGVTFTISFYNGMEVEVVKGKEARMMTGKGKGKVFFVVWHEGRVGLMFTYTHQSKSELLYCQHS